MLQCVSNGLKLSMPEECTRKCTKDEPPKICYYFFSLELFPALSNACELCKPTTRQGLKNKPECACILVDGIERTVFSVNRMIPGPQIQVCKNDYIVVDVENMAEGIATTMHWHGLYQENYQHYDGVPFVTQCPIESFDTFRYQFAAAQSGTYFWHSHVAFHRLDGQHGPLIIREPLEDDPSAQYYDFDEPEHVILISDWMHELATERFPGMRHRLSGQTPSNILINGRGTYKSEDGTETDIELETFDVKPNARYRFRLINAFTSVCLAQFNIEDHQLLLIAQDGVNVEPVNVDTIVIGSGERIDFVINTNNTDVKTYWIQVRGLGECQETEVNQLAKLQYQGSDQQDSDPSDPPTYSDGLTRGILYNPLDASCNPEEGTICSSNLKTAAPFDEEILKVQPDVQIRLPFWHHNYNRTNTFDILYNPDPKKYAKYFLALHNNPLVSVVDDIIFKTPSAPPLTEPEGRNYFCDGPDSDYCKAKNGSMHCSCTHVRNIPLHSIVEVVIYDRTLLPWMIHPFHLHGGHFHVFEIGSLPDQSDLSNEDIDKVMTKHRERLVNKSYDRPSAKDSILVPQGGWVIFRFHANNPGYWLFHCHFDWHSITGMKLIFHVGSDSDLPPAPPNFPRCGSFKPPICFNP
ncbi:uncharacterized protein LOC103578078 [Microplitis demolitor]|uniref:uncharacterized protein LOC103578078 n=1 Tax=Microplitis demolitor TaxID=69319 RepID=UPI00235B630E|nr:uncharacterized protein LOC103578078 [Microplitis demolitor]